MRSSSGPINLCVSQASNRSVHASRRTKANSMRRFARLSALLLALPLPACSTAGAGTSGNAASSAMCKSVEIVRPSRTADKLSEPTARQIANNNIAIESGCKK